MVKIIFVLLFFIVNLANGQHFEMNGSILDGSNQNEPLAFATVEIEGLDLSVTTDSEGKFTFKLVEGTYDVVVSFVGYEPGRFENIRIGKEGKKSLEPLVLMARELSNARPIIASNI